MACITKKRGRMIIDFYDQNGRRRLKTLPEGTTKTKARKALREIEDYVDRGTYLPREGIPTFEKVAGSWLEYKKPNIRPSTHEQYQGHVKNHLAPYFGNIKINRVNFNAIEKFNIHCRDKGVTPPTLKKFLVTLGSILKYAVQKGYCEFNPVREIEKPKVTQKKLIDILNPKEIRALIDNTANQKSRCLYTLTAMSGMRQGELLGLKWTDIDWFNCQVYVRRTFNHSQFHEPKTEASRRAIDLGPTVISELKKWKIACPGSELNLVFPNEAGNPIDANNLVKRDFEPTLRRAGVKGIRFHDLRHTYASLLIDRGEHPKYIQVQMGHSSINVTMDTYGHLMKAVNQDAAKGLDEAVFGKDGDFLETKTKKGLNRNG